MDEKLTKEQILEKFRNGEIDDTQVVALLQQLHRKPIRFKVATASGWLSIYFDGLRRPVSMPYECARELVEQPNIEALRAFLECNAGMFKLRDKRGK